MTPRNKNVVRLTKRERLRLLRIIDELLPRIPERAASTVDRELKAIRQARRSGGRRHPSDGNKS